ncbi:MAG: ferrous iron transport protein A [Burkholderiaceae bacterium]|nr:ferrous iron transport protein A [Burkholderiaceae bacterium]
MTLNDLPLNQWHSVRALRADGDASSDVSFDLPLTVPSGSHTGASASHVGSDAASHTVSTRLQALGFLVGEPVRLLRRSWLKHGPLVVQVGNATFALRASEAACVAVDTVSASCTDTPAELPTGGTTDTSIYSLGQAV